MYLYIKATYQAWCQDQTEHDIRERYENFLDLAARIYILSRDEVMQCIKGADWFLLPNGEDVTMSDQNDTTDEAPVPCGCGRSPSGYCIGLHSLTEDQFVEWKIQNQPKETE